MKNEKAVVVFSGGQDSTTCLFWALEQFSEVLAVTFDYGQRHAQEIDHAKRIAETLGVSLQVLDMGLINQLSANALTRDSIEVEEQKDGLPSTFVPGRNLLFLSFAAIYADAFGARHLVTGVSETDFSGYPDCRDTFIRSLNVTLNLSMDKQFVIHTPLMWLDKAGVWELSDELGAFDFVQTETLTCYHGIPAVGCGTCPSCVLRNEGLKTYLAQKAGAEA
ncbi:7-cyano-7-deazaguanine synthase QueC [Planococcus sp. CP5-4]|uniref:7-cyano-7-deazaguanine synthase QueC n=1 Tax=unclassified Planococcus (in: firmicutes) TaxID=2662419 RepID=UPI001C231BBD|nr:MULTISPECIES: 7-cyano-7-deazaguanine synthase QueC [unclassified Planococcus (in: firmicutes)]MBU9672998.1 7-cyano-7-deazaguanine synthase QueC [Planococcus sp. CP5-4_YE]MBV0908770.1 7-cyano-7-deazaguanine synthase QueC [Planococcus sp. CP5-4_UN]MBW6063539.1 7-cyano-7-deazaguanine synthase QueC [Planococcus sp. CP5-4]